MKTTLSSKGQLVLPADVRSRDHLQPGDVFDVERIDRGEYRLTLSTTGSSNGVLDWLRACPEKEYFVPIDSESTDTL